MAYPALVAPELTPEMVQAGASLIRALDATDVPVSAAFWLLAGEEAGWRLVIASSAVDTIGQRSFYKQLAERVAEQTDSNLSMSYVAAVSPSEPLVALLRSVIHTGLGISGIRFTGNVVNGVLIPDVYIYRLT